MAAAIRTQSSCFLLLQAAIIGKLDDYDLIQPACKCHQRVRYYWTPFVTVVELKWDEQSLLSI